MSEYVEFEELKVGERYDILYYPTKKIYIANMVFECVLKEGEKVFRSQVDSSHIIIFSEGDKKKFRFKK